MKTQGFFLLRRPLLSTEMLLGFQKAAGNDPDLFEAYLKLIFSDQLLQQALHLASPQMHEQCLKLQSGVLGSGKPQVLKALYKYLIRMCTRSTPFGLFAGHSLGSIGQKTHVAFSRKERLTIKSSPDSEFLYRLSGPLLKKEAFLNQSKFYPNSSLYPFMDGYRYIERVSEPSEGFLLSALLQSRYLSLVLAHAKKGITISELAELLIRNKAPKKKVSAFVSSLIDAQVLVSSFEMNATGQSYIHRLKNGLENMKGLQQDLAMLDSVEKILKHETDLISCYEKIKEVASSTQQINHPRHILQTDLVFNTQACEISSATFDILQDELQQLTAIAQQNNNPDLRQFARKLFRRFGSKPISLLVALDPASGIGFGSLNPIANDLPLLEGLASNLKTQTVKQTDSPFIRLQKTVFERAKKNGLQAIELTIEDLSLFNGPGTNHFPKNFYLLGSMIAGSEAAVDAGNFLFDLKAMAGPSGLNLMTRFCDANPELEARLRQAAINEYTSDEHILYAEICHVAQSRSLNILKRPSLYNYEIPYLSASGLDPDFQIQPSELLVSSPDGIQIILESSRLGKRIIPRLSSAHNYGEGLPFYKFLCQLAQDDNGACIEWHWPEAVEETFFPRITFKHLILQKARWHLDGSMHEKLTGSIQEILGAWQVISQQLTIPRYFQIQQGDNELLIDGQDIFSLQLLVDYLKKSKTLRLIEYLHDSVSSFITEGGNAVNNEMVIPFTGEGLLRKHEITKATPAEPESYSLGSEWLYVKIYCSPQAADFILTRIIWSSCETRYDKSIIDKWFFIRYYDPEPHLRLRMKLGDQSAKWSSLLQQLHSVLEPHMNSGLISAINTDTYIRETDRYTLLPYEKLEGIFHIESKMVCQCLHSLSQQEDPNIKWLLATRGCVELLSSLGLNIAEKADVISELHEQFTAEFGKDPKSLVTADRKYRNFKKRIAEIINPKLDQANQIESFVEHFDVRTDMISSALRFAENKTAENVKDLASNLVHLFLNRWFSTDQRRQEWVIYHFLKKYYDTILNLSKKPKNPSV